MSPRLLSLLILFVGVALCPTARAQGAGGIGGGGSMAVGGAGGLATGGNMPTGGAPGGGNGGEPNGAGGGGVTAPVSAGAGGFSNESAREIDGCHCRTVKSAPSDGLWLFVIGAALTRCRRRSR